MMKKKTSAKLAADFINYGIVIAAFFVVFQISTPPNS